MATQASKHQRTASPSPERSAPPDVPHDYQPSRVRSEQEQQSSTEQPVGNGHSASDDARGGNASAEEGFAGGTSDEDASIEDVSEPTRLFAEALAYMNATGGCVLNLMLAPTDGGQGLRLTITGQHRADAGEGDEDLPDGPPFKPITLTGTPDELDDPANGLEQFLRERTDQVQSLREARQRADKAHEQAVKAEERREEKAKQKKAENSESGPLFSGSDSDEDSNEDSEKDSSEADND